MTNIEEIKALVITAYNTYTNKIERGYSYQEQEVLLTIVRWLDYLETNNLSEDVYESLLDNICIYMIDNDFGIIKRKPIQIEEGQPS